MVTLVKLGGSYITDKSKPETVRRDRLKAVASELSELPGPKIVVHGGGSFGHYNALKYGIDNPAGISRTRLAMLRLAMSVSEALTEAGLAVDVFPGGSHFIIRRVLGERVPIVVNFYPISRAIYSGIVPITYGDVTLEVSKLSSKYTIISGDEIAYAIARYTTLGYSMRVLMISDVDAIRLSRGGPRIVLVRASEGKYVDETGNSGPLEDIEFRDVADATGGMRTKFLRALRIARLGVPVVISNSVRSAHEGRGTRIEF